MSLIHAYITLPYNRTLDTSAFISYIFTRTFVIPKVRQLVYNALNVRFAATNLAYMITSGYTDALEIIKPKYLNFYTVPICYLHT
jgi:hypothetical protein